MSLFNRVATLLIGEPGSPEGLLIKELHITFKIKKTEKPETNTCEIEVYNLSESSRKKIYKLRDIIILQVGYLDNSELLENIFTGNITNLNHLRQGPDWITKMESNDGENDLNNKKVTLKYKEGTGAKQVLNDLINTFGIPKDFISNLTDIQFGKGFSFEGMAKDAFNKLANKLGFNWSIQDRKLQIIKNGDSTDKPVIFLSPKSGLIGSPEYLEDLSDSQDAGATDKRPGWRVNSLLYPGATIGGKIEIESQEIKKGSIFKIINIEHAGDTHGNDWNTSLNIEETFEQFEPVIPSEVVV
jgi:hypothetical protein